MARRVMPILMLFIAAASCMSQGVALVLCRCSGDVFVGSAPEVCCEECGPSESVCVFAKQEGGTPVSCGVAGDCWKVLARGWDTVTPASARETAPAPLVADAPAPFMGFMSFTMPAPVAGLAWESFHRPEPPGRPRALLYGSLRI